jgi:predicted amidohydrolase
LVLWIVGGTVPWLSDEQRAAQAPVTRVYSASQVFDADGRCVARYCKMHLFDVDVADAHGRYRESDDFLQGDVPVVIDTPVGRLGLAICYDLRFPELFRALRANGAELFSLPSAFTRVTTEAHWWPLIRARAIENQCYVLAANQGGQHNDTRETGGQSAIISPWGDALVQCQSGESVCVAAIDRTALLEMRHRMPVHEHRRAHLFGGD